MGERVLRGSRLGSMSYESDRNTELAARQRAEYDCLHGHRFVIPFAAEAELPQSWECRVCGAPAQLVDGGPWEAKKVKAVRTHWDMLLERRTLSDLEEVLTERLTLLQQRRPKLTA